MAICCTKEVCKHNLLIVLHQLVWKLIVKMWNYFLWWCVGPGILEVESKELCLQQHFVRIKIWRHKQENSQYNQKWQHYTSSQDGSQISSQVKRKLGSECSFMRWVVCAPRLCICWYILPGWEFFFKDISLGNIQHNEHYSRKIYMPVW